MQSQTQNPSLAALELTGAITAIANGIACHLSADEAAFLSVILVQLGDTLATIAAVKECEESTQVSLPSNIKEV